MIDFSITTAENVSEPVTLEQVKSHLRIYDSNIDDGYIESLIKPAREKAEQATGQSLVAHTIVYENSDTESEDEQVLLYPPIGEVSKVEYFDGSSYVELDSEAYTVGGARGKWVSGISDYSHIRITYTTTGWGNEDLKRLILDLILLWYDERPNVDEAKEKAIINKMAKYKVWQV